VCNIAKDTVCVCERERKREAQRKMLSVKVCVRAKWAERHDLGTTTGYSLTLSPS
jgi:hypothetical protein